MNILNLCQRKNTLNHNNFDNIKAKDNIITSNKKNDGDIILGIENKYKIVCPPNVNKDKFDVITMIFDELDFSGKLIVSKEDLEYNEETFTLEIIKLYYQKLIETIKNEKFIVQSKTNERNISHIKEMDILLDEYVDKMEYVLKKYNQEIKQIEDEYIKNVSKIQDEIKIIPNKTEIININILDKYKYYGKLIEDKDKNFSEIRNEFFRLLNIGDNYFYFKDIFEFLKDYEYVEVLKLLKCLNVNKYKFVKKKNKIKNN